MTRGPSGIKEVARIAGVSIGTVSNTLNYPEKVSESTRVRVEAVMERIGFVRNVAAAGVRRGHGTLIGLVIPDITNPYFAEVARGAVDAAFAAGYVVVLCTSEVSAERESRYLGVLEEQRAAGVILNPVGRIPPELARLRQRGTHTVLVDRSLPASEGCSVSVDDVYGGQLAVEHLLAGGARSVVLINGPTSLRQCADRRRGARRAVTLAGLPQTTLSEVTSRNMTVSGGFAAAQQALEIRPDLDGLFCANDLMAIGAVRAVQAVRRVPSDVAVIGYDDIPGAADAPIPLTSVSQPKYELGVRSAELLLKEIEKSAAHKHERVRFTPELVLRESSRDAT